MRVGNASVPGASGGVSPPFEQEASQGDTVTHTYEPQRDVLDTKQNKVGTGVISYYDYHVNDIGQRTEVSTSGTAFPGIPSWIWGYDSHGQVTAANSSVNIGDRAYGYDAIGNRKKSLNSLTLPGSDNYTGNAPNSLPRRKPDIHTRFPQKPCEIKDC